MGSKAISVGYFFRTLKRASPGARVTLPLARARFRRANVTIMSVADIQAVVYVLPCSVLHRSHYGRFHTLYRTANSSRAMLNHLRKYNARVCKSTVHNCAIVFDTDRDFGYVPTLDIQSDANLNQIAMHSMIRILTVVVLWYMMISRTMISIR